MRADGFLFNCICTDKLVQNSLTTFFVPLVKSFKANEKLKIALWHQSKEIDLQLSGTFNLNDEAQCNVGYFNSNCGGMLYSSDEKGKNGPANVITLDKMGKYTYLFYVRMVRGAMIEVARCRRRRKSRTSC